MNHYRIDRTNDIPLEFNGELLAEASSQGHGQEGRWTEYRVFRTSTGRYVVECVGRTTILHETDRVAADVAETANDLPAVLRAHRRYLTHLAREVLTSAHSKDNSIPLSETA